MRKQRPREEGLESGSFASSASALGLGSPPNTRQEARSCRPAFQLAPLRRLRLTPMLTPRVGVSCPARIHCLEPPSPPIYSKVFGYGLDVPMGVAMRDEVPWAGSAARSGPQLCFFSSLHCPATCNAAPGRVTGVLPSLEGTSLCPVQGMKHPAKAVGCTLPRGEPHRPAGLKGSIAHLVNVIEPHCVGRVLCWELLITGRTRQDPALSTLKG